MEIDKAGETVNIRAKNGVVMTMGGFENNKQMVEDFLGLTKSTPAGTLFNTGDGVKMAMGVGARSVAPWRPMRATASRSAASPSW